MAISFTRVLRSEFQKTTNSWGLRLSILGPLAVTLIIFLGFWNNAENASADTNPWFDYCKFVFQFFFFLYPLFVALLAFLLSNIEHKNRGFKQIFTQPAPKLYFYLSKVTILLSWVITSLLTGAVMIWVFGNLLALVVPAYGFQDYPIPTEIWIFLVRLGITIIGILSIHFFMSLYWDNFIVTVGSAVFLLILGMVLFGNWKYAKYYLYTYPVQHIMEFNTQSTSWWTQESSLALLYAAVFLVAGFILLSRKNIT
jgi:hypothetical protein